MLAVYILEHQSKVTTFHIDACTMERHAVGMPNVAKDSKLVDQTPEGSAIVQIICYMWELEGILCAMNQAKHDDTE